MTNMATTVYVVDDARAKDIKKESIRDGFGRGLLEAGKQNDQVVAICADLTDSTKMSLFAEAFRNGLLKPVLPSKISPP